MKKVLISMSGGVDSSTLACFMSNNYDVIPAVFAYNSNHNIYEREALCNFLSKYNMKLPITIPLGREIFSHSNSSLLDGRDIPEGHYQAENMKSTVVPGRNLIFISILASIAESIGDCDIALGVHQGDHFIYPDSRINFLKAAKKTVNLSSDGKVFLLTPFSMCNKTEIIRIGLDLGIDYSLTRTCYKNQPIACGKCGSCHERLEAFKENNVKDPIQYEA